MSRKKETNFLLSSSPFISDKEIFFIEDSPFYRFKNAKHSIVFHLHIWIEEYFSSIMKTKTSIDLDFIFRKLEYCQSINPRFLERVLSKLILIQIERNYDCSISSRSSWTHTQVTSLDGGWERTLLQLGTPSKHIQTT